MAKLPLKSSKLQVPIDFRFIFYENCSNPRDMQNSKFLNKIWGKLDKILKIKKNGKISIKIFKKLPVSVDFSSKILINSLASGLRPGSPYKCIFLIF